MTTWASSFDGQNSSFFEKIKSCKLTLSDMRLILSLEFEYLLSSFRMMVFRIDLRQNGKRRSSDEPQAYSFLVELIWNGERLRALNLFYKFIYISILLANSYFETFDLKFEITIHALLLLVFGVSWSSSFSFTSGMTSF